MSTKAFTKNGHDIFEMSSLLQKAIRRGHHVYAGYAANELMVRYPQYLWRRLLTISAEDCWGCVTQEIMALKNADDLFRQKSGEASPIFVAKAVTLLLKAEKNRDADYFACNFLNSRDVLDLSACERNFDRIPMYTYDCHTMYGKRLGKTKADMIRDEQQALNPHREGDYDNLSWDRFFYLMDNGFYQPDKITPRPPKDVMDDIESGDTFQQSLF